MPDLPCSGVYPSRRRRDRVASSVSRRMISSRPWAKFRRVRAKRSSVRTADAWALAVDAGSRFVVAPLPKPIDPRPPPACATCGAAGLLGEDRARRRGLRRPHVRRRLGPRALVRSFRLADILSRPRVLGSRARSAATPRERHTRARAGAEVRERRHSTRDPGGPRRRVAPRISGPDWPRGISRSHDPCAGWPLCGALLTRLPICTPGHACCHGYAQIHLRRKP